MEKTSIKLKVEVIDVTFNPHIHITVKTTTTETKGNNHVKTILQVPRQDDRTA